MSYTTFFLQSPLNIELANKLTGHDDWDVSWRQENELYTYAKWYEYDRDMKKMSLEFPDVTFRLDGFGDPDDIWRNYYRHGKVQQTRARIIFDEFDSTLLE